MNFFLCVKNMEKNSSSRALFSPLGRWTGNNFLFKGGLRYQLRPHEVTYHKKKRLHILRYDSKWRFHFLSKAGNSTKVGKIASLSFGEKRFKVSYLSAVKVSPTQRSRSQSSQTAVSAHTSSICLDISSSPEEEEEHTCHERAFLTTKY